MEFDFLKNAARDAASKQIPDLIQKYEPSIEKSLSVALKTLKTEHPEEAQLFLTNWKKIDSVVKSVLSSAGGKRTRRNKQNSRKLKK